MNSSGRRLVLGGAIGLILGGAITAQKQCPAHTEPPTSTSRPQGTNIRKRLADPALRVEFQAETLERVRSDHPGIAEMVGIDPELEARLFELLTDHAMTEVERFHFASPRLRMLAAQGRGDPDKQMMQGGVVDRRSDLFSLGVLLFELSTGRALFPQNNELAVMKAITEGTIARPSEIDAAYPAGLERIVLRALAREPNERYATAQEMQRDLEAFARQHRLDLSPAALVELLQTCFRDDVDAWQIARESGTTLEQHIVRSCQSDDGQTDGEPDRDVDADDRPCALPFEVADRDRSPADQPVVPIRPEVLSSAASKGPEARWRGWLVVTLSAGFVAAVIVFAASLIFSASGLSPNAETLLQEAEKDLLKAQDTIREIEETLPCEPPSCDSATAVFQPPPVPKPTAPERNRSHGDGSKEQPGPP